MATERENDSRFTRFFDGFFLLRPTLIFPLWTILLAGHKIVDGREEIGTLRWTLFAAAMTALFGLVYLLNQMRDRVGDRHNGKSALVAHDLLERKTQIVIGVVLGITAPSALIASGFGHLGLWMVATFAVAGILYNYTPIALEKTPFGGIISGAAGSWLLMKLGESVAGSQASFLHELPYMLAFSAGCLLTSLPDLNGDRETGKRTFAVAFGERATTLLAGLLIATAGSIAIYVADWVMLAPVAGGLIFIMAALIRRDYRLAVAGNKVSIFLLALGVAIFYPYFLVAIAVYFPMARWYHKHRFGLAYPNFRAEYAGDTTTPRLISQYDK